MSGVFACLPACLLLLTSERVDRTSSSLPTFLVLVTVKIPSFLPRPMPNSYCCQHRLSLFLVCGLPPTMAQIALTTVFTPPASCLDNSYTSYAASVYVKDVKVQASACYPEGFQSLWSLGEPFSPGVCPESYAAVSSSTTKGGKSGRDETRVLCCPG